MGIEAVIETTKKRLDHRMLWSVFSRPQRKMRCPQPFHKSYPQWWIKVWITRFVGNSRSKNQAGNDHNISSKFYEQVFAILVASVYTVIVANECLNPIKIGNS
jgi:hypothetical protein